MPGAYLKTLSHHRGEERGEGKTRSTIFLSRPIFFRIRTLTFSQREREDSSSLLPPGEGLGMRGPGRN
jgi:hypothetical protein